MTTRKVSSCFECCDMPIRHSGKDVQNDVGELNIDFRVDNWADTNLSYFYSLDTRSPREGKQKEIHRNIYFILNLVL